MMKKHKQIWIAISFLVLAAIACQSQETISSPAAPDPETARMEIIQPTVVEKQPNETQVTVVEDPLSDIASSIKSHSSVLGYSFAPQPTIDPETGQSGAELLQIGTLPLVSSFNPPAGCAAITDADIETAVLDYVNGERTRAGLGTLAAQYQLSAAATLHATDMACKNYFSHTGSDGSSPFDRIKAQGYIYYYAGENLFAGNGVYNNAGQAVSAWMNSPGHRQNILNPEFTEAGVSYVFNADSTYGAYFAIVFARP
jgi:uncharacterized protein YkwD